VPLQKAITKVNLPCIHCFRSLGINSRMIIYSYLKGCREANVTQITSQVRLKQPTVSYHLQQMQEQGLLVRTKRGKEVIYSLNLLCSAYNKECVLKHVELENYV
jgi:DNA-binding transcriptional ArsR family regulator